MRPSRPRILALAESAECAPAGRGTTRRGGTPWGCPSSLSEQAEEMWKDKAGRRCRSAGERRWLRAEPAPAPPPPARSHRRSVTTGRLTRPLGSTCLFKLSTQTINTFNYPYRETNQSPSALGCPLRFLTRKKKQRGGGRSGVGGGGVLR